MSSSDESVYCAVQPALKIHDLVENTWNSPRHGLDDVLLLPLPTHFQRDNDDSVGMMGREITTDPRRIALAVVSEGSNPARWYSF